MLVLLMAAASAILGGALVRQGIARWSDRETTITVKREQISRWRALLANADSIRAEVAGLENRRESETRLMRARSAAAAGADVQSYVQEQAAASNVTVSSLDVAGDAERSGPVPVVPVTVAAIGDIYGVAAWLDRLQYGSPLLEIRELVITPNSALRGELLQVSLTLRAAYVEVP